MVTSAWRRAARFGLLGWFGAGAALAAACGAGPDDGVMADPDAGAAPLSAPGLELAETLARNHPELLGALAPTARGFAPEGAQLVSPGWAEAYRTPRHSLGVRLPVSGHEAVRVGVGQSERHTVALTPADAQPSTARVHRGRVFYPDVYPSTDAVWVSTPERAEWFYVLHDDDAPDELRFHVALPPGLPTIRREPGGAFVVADASGRAQLRFPLPFIIDANGERHGADLHYADGTLTLSYRGEQLAYPALLDPIIETAVWEQLDVGQPTYRYDSSLVYDSTRQEVLLFGGYGTGYLGDTWTWDGARWTLAATTGPSPRSQALLIDQPDRQRVLLFGGATGYLGDTWEWDGTRWTSLPVVGPPGRQGHAGAYDPVRRKAIMYGGAGTSGTRSDFWQWDGTAWTAIADSAPGTRYNHEMLWDTARGQAVMVGGTAGNLSTWLWDGTAWTAGPSYPNRTQAGAAWDSVRQRVVVFGGYSGVNLGDTWEWDGTSWIQRLVPGPSPRDQVAMTFDEGRGESFLFGTSGVIQGGEAWAFNGTDWRRVGPPQHRSFAAASYDTVRRRMVVFGGQTGSTLRNDTWEWTGTAWSAATPATSPTARYITSSVFDPSRGRVVLFGGVTGGSTYSAETWEWDGLDWSQAVGTAPTARSGPLAFHPGTQQVVMFGGFGGTGSGLGDTWLRSGLLWSTVTPAASPPGRRRHATATLSATGEAVIHGGSDAAGARTDTWVWDGTTWSARGTGPGRLYPALAEDASRSQLVLFGGTDNAGAYYADTWVWNGTTWSPLSYFGGPSARQAAGMVWDPDGERILLHAGLSATGDVADLWSYRSRGGACVTGTDCGSGGACVDGVCCDSPACGPCEACNLPTSPGVCSLVPAGGNDPDTCGSAVVACDGAGACKTRQGQSCTVGTACITGRCVDGVCCDTACTGACETCNVTGSEGRCLPSPAGDPGVPSCAPYACRGDSGSCPTACASNAECMAGYACSGVNCAPIAGLGAPCALDGECGTGFCEDGVCCDAACTGPCVACSAARKGSGSDGTCGYVAAGADPDNDCALTATSSCGTTGSCDGAGACALHPAGTACGSSCTAGALDQRECDGNGTCQSTTVACAPYLCTSPTACGTSCTINSQCATGTVCTGGRCQGTSAAGVACTIDYECSSGHCVEGVCCDTACDGVCESCTTAGKGQGADGSCGPVGVGRDPDDECADQGADSCGTTGACDGARACARYGTSTVCSTVCTSGSVVESHCDGAGSCGQPTVVSCAPFLCGAVDACASSCAADTDCVTGSQCQAGVCTGTLTAGQQCRRDADCKSAHCVDGVCCDTACAGRCQACSAARKGFGADGACEPVAEGTDPDDDCSDDGAASCGQDGTCSGTGVCRRYAKNTPCGATSCNGNDVVGDVCDGAGTCEQSSGSDCAPYVCRTNRCASPCAGDADCVNGTFCDTGVCAGQRAAGEACSEGVQCQSGFCADQRCCNTVCSGQCEACDVAGQEGTCAAVTGIPHGSRPSCGGEGGDCGGSCDGAFRDACSYPGTAVACTASCTEGVETLGVCDGAGTCRAGTQRTRCDPYVCGAERCNTDCGSDEDCVAGNVCADDGKCGPAPPATCIDESTMRGPDGSETFCSPYRCAAGQCRSACSTTTDCVEGFVCDGQQGQGVCIRAESAGGAPPAADDGGCGCRTPPRRSSGGAALVLVALALLRRRRR